jgi:signal peptidase I
MRGIRNFIKKLFGLAIFLVIVLIIGRIFLFEVAVTKSYAMVPNLVSGDVFLVYKRILLGPGDIAVCRNPEDPQTNIVLRIIGVPGSTVSISNDHVFINDNLVERSFEGQLLYEDHRAEETLEYFVDLAHSFVGGHAYALAFMDRSGGKNFQKHTVRDGFFVLGDNRNMARDSRHFGEVTVDDCVGKAVLLLWPAEDNGDLKWKDRFLDIL